MFELRFNNINVTFMLRFFQVSWFSIAYYCYHNYHHHHHITNNNNNNNNNNTCKIWFSFNVFISKATDSPLVTIINTNNDALRCRCRQEAVRRPSGSTVASTRGSGSPRPPVCTSWTSSPQAAARPRTSSTPTTSTSCPQPTPTATSTRGLA